MSDMEMTMTAIMAKVIDHSGNAWAHQFGLTKPQKISAVSFATSCALAAYIGTDEGWPDDHGNECAKEIYETLRRYSKSNPNRTPNYGNDHN